MFISFQQILSNGIVYLLQLPQQRQKLIKSVCTLHLQVFVLEHHIIAVCLLASGILPCTTQTNFFSGLCIFQLVAFGFNQNNLSTGRADDKIRVMVAESVQTERKLVTLRVAMPPADIVHVGHCKSHFIFQTIHLALGLVQALAH